MNRRLRKHIRNLAYWLEDVVVPWLHQKAERPAQVKPLAFPKPFEEMMERIMQNSLRNLANSVVADLMEGPPQFCTDLPRDLKVRLPKDYK